MQKGKNREQLQMWFSCHKQCKVARMISIVEILFLSFDSLLKNIPPKLAFPGSRFLHHGVRPASRFPQRRGDSDFWI
jgi:hypothetical protein